MNVHVEPTTVTALPRVLTLLDPSRARAYRAIPARVKLASVKVLNTCVLSYFLRHTLRIIL